MNSKQAANDILIEANRELQEKLVNICTDLAKVKDELRKAKGVARKLNDALSNAEWHTHEVYMAVLEMWRELAVNSKKQGAEHAK